METEREKIKIETRTEREREKERERKKITILIYIYLYQQTDINNCVSQNRNKVKSTVLLLDGNSEIDTHERINALFSICLSHLIRLRALTNRFFSSPK